MGEMKNQYNMLINAELEVNNQIEDVLQKKKEKLIQINNVIFQEILNDSESDLW
jgi:hypothetical protein